MLVYNDKTRSMRKDFFYSVDKAARYRRLNSKSPRNARVVLIIRYFPVNVFVL